MKIIVFLAEGFEEIEAVTCVDVLRRAGIEVTTVALNDVEVTGAHNMIIKADKLIQEINYKDYEGVILPGGMPGATNLRDNEEVINIVKQLYLENKLVGAICAAPIVLDRAGIIEGKKATSYPGFDKEMLSCNYIEDRVVVDKNIITSRGPGIALDFAIKIIEYLIDKDKASEIEKQMLV